MTRRAILTVENIEAIKNSLNQAREAIKNSKNEEADRSLQNALFALDDIVYDDH